MRDFNQVRWQQNTTALFARSDTQARLAKLGLSTSPPSEKGNCVGLSYLHSYFISQEREPLFFEYVSILSSLSAEKIASADFSFDHHCAQYGLNADKYYHFVHDVVTMQNLNRKKCWDESADNPFPSYHETNVVTFGNYAQIAADIRQILEKNPQTLYQVHCLSHGWSLHKLDACRVILYDPNGRYQEYSLDELPAMVKEIQKLGSTNEGFEFPLQIDGMSFERTELVTYFEDTLLPQFQALATTQPKIQSILEQNDQGLSIIDTVLLLENELQTESELQAECTTLLSRYLTSRETWQNIQARDPSFIPEHKALQDSYKAPFFTFDRAHTDFYGDTFVGLELKKIIALQAEKLFLFHIERIICRLLDNPSIMPSSAELTHIDQRRDVFAAYLHKTIKVIDFSEVKIVELVQQILKNRPDDATQAAYDFMTIELLCRLPYEVEHLHYLVFIANQLHVKNRISDVLTILRKIPGTLTSPDTLRYSAYETLFKNAAVMEQTTLLEAITFDLVQADNIGLLTHWVEALPGALGVYVRNTIEPITNPEAKAVTIDIQTKQITNIRPYNDSLPDWITKGRSHAGHYSASSRTISEEERPASFGC